MSKLDKLIKELCNDGVEYKPLWELTAWDKRFNAVDKSMQKKIIKYHYFLASDLKPLVCDDGDIKILTTNTSDLYTKEELVHDYVSEGEIVAIPWGGNPNVQYYKGKFITADNRIMTSLDTSVLDNKFLYYYLQSKIDLIASFYRGSGIKHPSMLKMLTLQIPLPDLLIQREIVHILDSFTLLTAELTAELTARRQQYEYFREELMKFENAPIVSLDSLFPYIRNGFVGTVTKFFTDKDNGVRYLEGTNIHNGMISDNKELYVTQEFHQKHIKNELKPNDILMVQSGHIGECAVVGEKYKGANCHALIILSNGGSCVSKFYVHYFHTYDGLNSLRPAITDGSLKHVLAGKMKLVKVPFPPIEEQKRIVSILDRFDKLCNDISEGIPAEIEARQKQYEYYRDKLLAFNVKEN